MATSTSLLRDKNFLILKSGNIISSKQLLGSRRVIFRVVFLPFLSLMEAGLYPPSTRISNTSPATITFSFFPKKNHQIKPINPIPTVVTKILSIIYYGQALLTESDSAKLCLSIPILEPVLHPTFHHLNLF